MNERRNNHECWLDGVIDLEIDKRVSLHCLSLMERVLNNFVLCLISGANF